MYFKTFTIGDLFRTTSSKHEAIVGMFTDYGNLSLCEIIIERGAQDENIVVFAIDVSEIRS